jgi:hypothetical protein
MLKRFSSHHPTRRLVLGLGIASAIAAIIIIPLELSGNSSGSARVDSPSTTRPSESGTAKSTHSQTSCGTTGCAIVSEVVTNPRVTVFYGASCAGPNGPWYLNVTQGGPNNTPRPSYKLQWAFRDPPSPAHPNGLISVSTPAGVKVKMTLANGVLRITGHHANGVNVNATGTLAVGLSQTATGQALVFTEGGIAAAEHALGITSPFGVNGQPTTIPLKIVNRFASC